MEECVTPFNREITMNLFNRKCMFVRLSNSHHIWSTLPRYWTTQNFERFRRQYSWSFMHAMFKETRSPCSSHWYRYLETSV